MFRSDKTVEKALKALKVMNTWIWEDRKKINKLRNKKSFNKTNFSNGSKAPGRPEFEIISKHSSAERNHYDDA